MANLSESLLASSLTPSQALLAASVFSLSPDAAPPCPSQAFAGRIASIGAPSFLVLLARTSNDKPDDVPPASPGGRL